MNFLNKKDSLILYKQVTNTPVFVDKSKMIHKINTYLNTLNKYICITRPRRFGKTINAQMLASYYTKGYGSHELFDKLLISKEDSYETHINQHNVIYIDFTNLLSQINTYEEFETRFVQKLVDDLCEFCPKIKLNSTCTLSDYFYQTESTFIFVMDEWMQLVIMTT